MPDLREVFQMSTQKVRPDRGFAERQEIRQRRRMRNRKIGVYALVAAIVVIALVAIAEVRNGPTRPVPAHDPTPTEGLGPTTLAKGEDVELVGGSDSGLGAQTLNINAEEENGKATGEFRITDNVIRVDCADTDTDGVVIVGGEATEGPDVAVGDLLALIIREGDPDSVAPIPMTVARHRAPSCSSPSPTTSSPRTATSSPSRTATTSRPSDR